MSVKILQSKNESIQYVYVNGCIDFAICDTMNNPHRYFIKYGNGTIKYSANDWDQAIIRGIDFMILVHLKESLTDTHFTKRAICLQEYRLNSIPQDIKSEIGKMSRTWI